AGQRRAGRCRSERRGAGPLCTAPCSARVDGVEELLDLLAREAGEAGEAADGDLLPHRAQLGIREERGALHELLELLGAAGDLRDLERRAGEGGLEDGLVTGELDLGAAAQVAAGGADLDAVGARLHHPGAGPGAPVLQLGGGDVDAHALRGSRLEL